MSINYHPETVWLINSILLAVSLAISFIILIYTSIKYSLATRRANVLASIEENFLKLAKSGGTAVHDACPAIVGIAREEDVLEILYDRDKVFPKGFEQNFKQCLIDSGKLSDLEHIAASSSDKWRKVQALISIGYAASPKALEILGKAVMDRDDDISYFSLVALSRIKNKESAKILLDSLVRKRFDGHRIVSFLETYPSDAIEEASKVTYNRDANVRFWAVNLLGKIGSKQEIPRLIELLMDKSDDVRAASCEALATLRATQAAGEIKHCLKDRNWLVRLHAVTALDKLIGAQCINDCAGLIVDEAWLVRDAVKSVFSAHIEEALPYIEKSFAESSVLGNKECVEALEEAGYFSVMFKNILSQDAQARTKALVLFKGVIKVGGHSGLESVLAGLGKDAQKKLLEAMAQINRAFAEHIEKRLRLGIEEA